MKYIFVLALMVVAPTYCVVPQVMGMYVISGEILTCLICVTTIWRWGIM